MCSSRRTISLLLADVTLYQDSYSLFLAITLFQEQWMKYYFSLRDSGRVQLLVVEAYLYCATNKEWICN